MISEDDARAELARRALRFRAAAAGREKDLIRSEVLGTAVPDELLGSLPAVHAGLRQVADGWLLWITDHRGEESVRGPGRRIHLFEHAGVAQAHRWPNWPVDEIADRISSAAPTDRFPPVAVAVLEDAGWFPGRALPEAEITAWAAARVPDDDVRLHDAARRALVEFGGLRLHSDGVCDLEFFPHPAPDIRWREAASLAQWAGSVLFPVAEDRRQRVEGLVVVLEDGPGISGVVLAGEIDQYVVGRTVDEMIINYATGAPPQPVD